VVQSHALWGLVGFRDGKLFKLGRGSLIISKTFASAANVVLDR
jgi:hypothetical protein